MTTLQSKLQCDICLKKDGWKGMLLQQCCKCGVCVHNECYCGVVGKTNKTWQCFACQAVGTEIEGFTLEGRKHKIMKVTEKPVECVLCSIASGVHAMHALYHYWGEFGRQAILPGYRSVPQRLAWVHTLCALLVCQNNNTRGTVYGCDEQGDFEGNGKTAYFVMCGLNGVKRDEVKYVKNLKEHRELKCVVCGKQEKTAGRNLRVPLQCRAGDEGEFEEFKKHHENIEAPCTQAMHVGCAMWGTEGVCPQEPRQVWFFPGADYEEEVEETVAEIFCECHAEQMGASMTGLKKSASQKNVGSTVLQRTVSGSEAPELANAMETTTKKFQMSQMSSKTQKDALQRKRSESSKTTKPSEGKSATGATRLISGQKKTQKSPLLTESIPRRTSKVTKASDSATPLARAIQQSPVPITASIPRRASAGDAIPQHSVPIVSSIPRRASANDGTKTHKSANSPGGTTFGNISSTIPRKAAPTQQTPAPITGSISRRSSASDAIQQAPSPIVASIPRRASSSDATRTDKRASPLGSTAAGALLLTIPRQVAPASSPPLPKGLSLSAKQRRNLPVPTHLRKSPQMHVAPTGESSMGYLSHLLQSQQVTQPSELLADDAFDPTEGEPTNPAVAAAIASTALQTSDDGKSAGPGKESVPEGTRQQPLEKRRRRSSISEHKQGDANTPTKRRRRRSISEGKEADVDQNESDDDSDSREDGLGRTGNRDGGEGDDGLWMDDEAYGLVQGNELERDSPEGEDPWAYLWKPGAPTFKMKLIACAERRNVEGLKKSLYSKK